MQVTVGKAAQHAPPGSIDHARLGRDLRRNSDDPTGPYADIDGRGSVGEPGLTYHEIEGHWAASVRSVPPPR